MPRRKQISCQQCRAKHLKCDGADPCFNCAESLQECTKPLRHVFRHEEGANIGITRHKTTFAFAYEPCQQWVSSSSQVDFVHASSVGNLRAVPKTHKNESKTGAPQRIRDNNRKDPEAIKLAQKATPKDSDEVEQPSLVMDVSNMQQSNMRNLSKTPSPTNDIVLHPTANREGLHSAYYSLHPGEADGGLHYFLQAANGSSTMALALDVIALLYLGTSHNEPNLKKQAQRRYILALSKFRHEIQATSAPPATFFGIIHIMETCELFNVTSCENVLGWQQHAFGNASVMEKVLESQTEEETWRTLNGPLTSGTRVPFSLWHGLSQRKRLKAHEKFWIRAKEQDSILSTAMTVPGVLEAADNALRASSEEFLLTILQSLTELTAIQSRLHQNLRKWGNKRPSLPYSLATATSFPTSLLHSRDIAAIPMSYSFYDLAAATTYLSYWLCSLLIQTSRLDAAIALVGFDCSSDQELQKRIDEADVYASNICRTLAYCTLAEHGFVGKINVVAPLAFAYEWYVRQENDFQVEWCANVALRLRAAGLAYPFATFAKKKS